VFLFFRYETRNTELPNEVSSSQLIFVFGIFWCNISTVRLPFSMLSCEQYFYIPLYRTSTKHYEYSTSSFFGVRQSFILLRHDVSETAKLCVFLSEEGSRTGLRKVVIFKFRRSVKSKKKKEILLVGHTSSSSESVSESYSIFSWICLWVIHLVKWICHWVILHRQVSLLVSHIPSSIESVSESYTTVKWNFQWVIHHRQLNLSVSHTPSSSESVSESYTIVKWICQWVIHHRQLNLSVSHTPSSSESVSES
jgi:hypothetical protein